MDRSSHAPRPDFICIGMQKAATNWIYDQFASHDGFWMPPIKELHYFDRAFNFERAYNRFDILVKEHVEGNPLDVQDAEFFRRSILCPAAQKQYAYYERFKNRRRKAANDRQLPDVKLTKATLKWYGGLFEVCGSDRMTGDITPGYSTLSTDTIGEIRNAFPDVRIIIGLRRPVERLWSQMCQGVRRPGTLSEEQVMDIDYVSKTLAGNPHITERSFPVAVYRKWESVFGAEAMIPYFFEDVVRSPETVRENVCAALGVEAGPGAFRADAREDSKTGNQRISMPENIRDLLESHFSQEIEEAKALFPEARALW